MDQHVKDYIRFSSPSISTNSDVFEPTSSNNAKQRATLVEWLNGILPDLSLPINASDEELRAFLVDGSVLCRLLNKLKPGSVTECVGSIRSSQTRLENVHRFLSAMDEMGLPRFQAADLEKGSMKIVLDCLLTLQTHFTLNADRHNGTDVSSRRLLSSPPFGEDRRKSAPESKFQRALRSPIKTEPSAALINHVGHKFHEVFQLKQVSYTDLPAARISEMMKSNSLDNAPTQSLLSVINGILDESIEQKNGEIPHRVACLLRKVVQEIERRICTQAEHLRTQNNLFKAREEKYQSRIRVLEALATGTSDETQIVMNQLQQIKSEKNKIEEKKKVEEQDMARLMKEKDNLNQEISNLRQQLEIAKRSSDEHQSKQVKARPGGGAQHELNNTSKEAESLLAESRNRVKELEERLKVAVSLQTELANKVKELEDRLKHDVSSQNESTDKVRELEDRLKETTNLLTESRNRVKELEDRLKVAVSLQTESINKVKELEDRLNVDVSSQSESTNKLRELEHRLKETTNLLTESTNKLTESTNKVKELEDRLKENVSSQAELTNKLKELEDRLKETTNLLTQSRNEVKELEASLESKSEWWKKKEQIYHIFTEFQLGALRELKFASQSIHQEIVKTKKNYSDEFVILGSKFKALDDAAKNYYSVLAENRKLHNELQELKGNIRVYCRIRPFLPGQKGKSSIIEYIGDNGELIVSNPSKQGKEGRRSFKFDKVYSPTSTQAEVFTDTQPLVQSVLDGYNVCIFAYGQTGSGKTYTMTGPDGATEDEWGVNYRALNNLFRISQSRESSFTYEVYVQMVEIYNEQVRDLLSNGGSAKRLGILSTSQPNGLAVPDASIHVVKTTSGVLELMDIGLKNRAKSSTALNERSSRSHSVVSIHARGLDLKSGSSLRGSLHLVDLAGSERVDRSEVTGDRLKEAQHINKSLSALGDVIFALAQKNSHVPYRNSKLTQVLQSSLGGQAKTLMFVQLNPDATSYSETLSTLKFAERVSGVELGAAKSSKDGRDVRELMEQVASLKDTIAKKDEEIETLQLLKDPKNGSNGEKRTTNSLRYGSSSSSSSSKYSMGGTTVTASSDQPAYDHHDYYSDEADGSSESISLHDEERQTRDVDKRKSRSAVPRASTKSASLRKSVSGTNLSTKSSRRWQ